MNATMAAPARAPDLGHHSRTEIRAELMRRSLAEFARQAWTAINPERPPIEWGWYLDALCLHLEAVTAGSIKRLIVVMPPNTLKSWFISVLWPAWVWTKKPSYRWFFASNEGTLATRDAGAMRRLVLSEWYSTNFRRGQWRLSPAQDEKMWFDNTAGGSRISYSTNSSVTGKKGDCITLEDGEDAKKASSGVQREATYEWATKGFFTRTDNEISSPIVVAGQYVHREGIINRLEAQGGWTVLKIREEYDSATPLASPYFLDPRTEDGQFLRPTRFAEVERDAKVQLIGRVNYETQHNANPIDREGLMFPRGLANVVHAVPAGTIAVRYWDTAASQKESACYTSGILIGRTPAGRYIVLHHTRGRWTPAERNGIMRNIGFADSRRTDCRVRKLYFERGASDAGMERDAALIKFLAGLPVEVAAPGGDKIVRAEPLEAQWKAGNVDYLDGDWNEQFLNDMEGFPSAKMKDTCFPAETPIITGRGILRIDDVTAADVVMTRSGWKNVLRSWKTSESEPVVTIRYGNGRFLTCTLDHPVYVVGRGFVSASKIGVGEEVLEWVPDQNPSCGTELFGDGTPTPRGGSIGFTTSAVGGGGCSCSTARNGSLPMAPSPSVITFTTPITTRRITNFPISNASLRKNTTRKLGPNDLCRPMPFGGRSTDSPRPDWQPPNGIAPMPDESGTAKTELLVPKNESGIRAYADCAGASSKAYARPLHYVVVCAQAGFAFHGQSDTPKFASDAETDSILKDSASGFAARRVLALTPEIRGVPVFNLTVEGVSEFVAGGLLVHNCDSASGGFNKLAVMGTGALPMIAPRSSTVMGSLPADIYS